MSAHFDPYHTWLGIPPEEQPPDAYRLLGIRRFENNQDVIKNAVEQRQSHIRSFLSGEWGARSQQVLDELSAARDRLLNPDTKGTYDRDLRQKDAPKLSKNSSAAPSIKPPAPRKPAGRPTGAPVLTRLPSADPLWEDPLQAQSFQQPSYPYGPPAGAAWQAGYPSPRPLWQQPVVLGAAVLVGLSLMGVALLVVLVVGWRVAFPGGGARQVVNNNPPQNSGGQFGSNLKPPSGQVAPNSGPPNRPGIQGFPSPPQRQSPQNTTPPQNATPPSGLSKPPSGPTSLIQPKPKEYVLQFGDAPRSYVELENTADIATLDGPNTIELWARWPEDGKNQTLMGNMWAEFKFEEKDRPYTGWALSVVREGGEGVMHFSTPGLGPSCSGQPLAAIGRDLRWHHFAYSFDGLGAEAYIDGKRASTPRLTPSAKENPKTNLFLGPTKFSPQNHFYGEICAFRISSSKRYKQDFDPPVTFDKDDKTITLLDFSKGQGQSIDDLSGQGHAGRITGVKWVAP